MAVVSHFSSQMVKGLYGTVDFYYWRGIPVARSWPRKTKLSPTAAVLASRLAFRQSRLDLREVSAVTRAAWAVCSVGARQAWLDYYTSIYLVMWKNYRRFPPVVNSFRFSSE